MKWIVLTTLALLIFAGGVHAQSYGPPTYSVGDTWTIKEGKTTLEIKVVKIEGESYFILGWWWGSCPTCIIQVDQNLTWLNILDSDGKAVDIMKFEFAPVGPKWRFLDFPLEVKKTWSTSLQALWRGSWLTFTYYFEVKAYEDVKTAAGTFKAYRIQEDYTVGGGTWSNRYRNVRWFAPEAKFTVKWTSTRADSKDWELASYNLK